MRRTARWVGPLVAITLIGGACSGGDGGDPSAFCDEVNRRADVIDTSGDISGAVEDLKALGRLAPDEIDEVIDRTRLLFEEVRDAPDDATAREILSTRAQEVTDLAAELTEYTARTCGLDLRRPQVATPTPTPDEAGPLEPA
ncbi:MAG: hypothetical protein RIE08_08550 [Acidimicrobiales bacterium]